MICHITTNNCTRFVWFDPIFVFAHKQTVTINKGFQGTGTMVTIEIHFAWALDLSSVFRIFCKSGSLGNKADSKMGILVLTLLRILPIKANGSDSPVELQETIKKHTISQGVSTLDIQPLSFILMV